MNARAVLFDLGNTLLEYRLHGQWQAFLRQRLEEVYETICDHQEPFDLPAADFAERAAEVIGVSPREQMHKRVSWPFADRLRRALDEMGLTCDADHVALAIDEFYAPIRDCTQPYSDTVEVLERLRDSGAVLAIISNTPWDVPGLHTRGDMRKWDIDRYFQARVFSGDVPWCKPDPEFFFAAATELGVAPAECVVVGDTLYADIAGANAAGIRSIWVDRGYGVAPWDGARPTVTVTSLTEAAEAVQ
jgi:HAD superfamily hydrolase (TIGR01509 family)